MKRFLIIMMFLQQAILLLAGESVYTHPIPDSGASSFIGIETDGKHDVSLALQEAIKVFSPNNPILIFESLDSQSGKSVRDTFYS